MCPSFLDFALPFTFCASSHSFFRVQTQKILIQMVFDVSDRLCTASIDTTQSTYIMRWDPENTLKPEILYLHISLWELIVCKMLTIVRFAPHQLTGRCSCSHCRYNEKWTLKGHKLNNSWNIMNNNFQQNTFLPNAGLRTATPLNSSFADERITQNKSWRRPCSRTSGFLRMWAVAFHVLFIDCTGSLPQENNPGRSMVGLRSDCAYAVLNTWISSSMFLVSSHTRWSVAVSCIVHRTLCVQRHVSRLVFIDCSNASSHGVVLNT